MDTIFLAPCIHVGEGENQRFMLEWETQSLYGSLLFHPKSR